MYAIYLLPVLVAIVLAQNQYTATEVAAVEAAKATARTESPTSYVKGKTFDRFVTIWCENTNYEIAAGDPNFAWLGTQGITLTNYHGVVHPSQPNYVAAVGGDTHGVIDSKHVYHIEPNVRTVVDLLDAKKISWGEYQEDMPYSGFEANWLNQDNGKNDYVRKHNGLMSYDSVTSKDDRLAQIKNYTMFEQDKENGKLPQWMFMTPNMTNNGHDSSVTDAGAAMRRLLEPLLKDSNFLNRTLVLLTFDESEVYTGDNKVFSVLLGDAVPVDKQGTTDDTEYNHYSQLATVERNWDLENLGLNDVDATPFF